MTPAFLPQRNTSVSVLTRTKGTIKPDELGVIDKDAGRVRGSQRGTVQHPVGANVEAIITIGLKVQREGTVSRVRGQLWERTM